MKLTQKDKIMLAILKGHEKKWWDARDFQNGDNFVGWEASARLSELTKDYYMIFEIAKDGRFRQVRLNWKNKQMIKQLIKAYKDVGLW